MAEREPVSLEGKQFCYWIPNQQDEATGFVPAIVVAGEPGYYMTDYNWGHDKAIAEQACESCNRNLGLDQETVWRIVASSMAASNRENGGLI